MKSWWKDERIRTFFFIGFAIGVAYKYVMWHVVLPHSVTDLIYEMPVRYMLQYITGGFIGGFAAAFGASLSLRKRD